MTIFQGFVHANAAAECIGYVAACEELLTADATQPPLVCVYMHAGLPLQDPPHHRRGLAFARCAYIDPASRSQIDSSIRMHQSTRSTPAVVHPSPQQYIAFQNVCRSLSNGHVSLDTVAVVCSAPFVTPGRDPEAVSVPLKACSLRTLPSSNYVLGNGCIILGNRRSSRARGHIATLIHDTRRYRSLTPSSAMKPAERCVGLVRSTPATRSLPDRITLLW